MTFDVHDLDAFLLVGSAVTLLAILAVRVSSRAGLPSLLLYLLIGVALGRGGARHRVREPPGRPRPGVRGAGDHPGRGRPDDLLAGGPAVDEAGSAARDARRRRVGHRRRGRRPLPARHSLGARRAARRDHVADGRRGSVLGAPRRAAPPEAGRHARGRVGAQRRPDRRPRHPDLERRVERPRTARRHRHRGVGAGRRRGLGAGLRLRRCLADAACGPSLVRPLPDRGALPDPAGLRRSSRGPRVRLRRGVRRSTDPGQPGAAAPGGDPVVRRGCRVASADRAVRDARAAALARPDHARRPSGSRSRPG